FEQVLPAVALLRRLMASCPQLQLLVTSRVRLRLPGEHEYLLAPLPLPLPTQEEAEEIGSYPAVALFLQRAREVLPQLTLTATMVPVVAAICRRLDGLPLAIELAASLVKLLPPQVMLDRLGEAMSTAVGRGGTLAVLSGGRGIGRIGTRPCTRPSPGAMICWSRTSSACFGAWRCLPGDGPQRPPWR
ncbi:MAG TPA: hypothetical protein VHB98_20935, partial [Chloroflexota bacterium]|nr:hypothetical protein [Chloroflexota bacterium]